MTEKGEDQVVWVCDKCFMNSNENTEHTKPCSQEEWELDNGGPCGHGGHTPTTMYEIKCSGSLTAYLPHSKYLALQKNLEGAEYIIDVEHRRNNKLESDLAVAVEALRRIAEPSSEDIVIPIRKIAKEALGKIGGKE